MILHIKDIGNRVLFFTENIEAIREVTKGEETWIVVDLPNSMSITVKEDWDTVVEQIRRGFIEEGMRKEQGRILAQNKEYEIREQIKET